MISIKEETFTKDLKCIDESDCFSVFLNKKEKYIICETKTSYIPVEIFIRTFSSLVDIIKSNGIEKFIFDKRALRAFHQPTMEWYFVEWKQKLLDIGLKKHRKILPKEAWFQKCVEAGKVSILKDNPKFPIEKIDIQYFDTIEECIDN